RQKLYQMIADYTADDAADQLTNDPVFKEIIGTDALASQPSLSRFFNRFDETSVEQLYQANQELLDKVHAHRGAESLILALDSTHADTYRDQEETAFNAHYGTVGFHPIVASDGTTRDFLKAKLRGGDAYTCNGAVPLVQPGIAGYSALFPEPTPCLRGDSGSVVPALDELCEEECVWCAIRLKATAKLKELADQRHPTGTPADITPA